MLRKNIWVAALSIWAMGTSASAQKLLAPADPVATLEGEWTGVRDESRVRVENGKVTLIHLDPDKAWTKYKPGLLIAVLNNGGKTRNEGRSYIFSSSQCLIVHTNNGNPRFEMEPCGENSATLTAFVNEYQLHLSGLAFRIPRDGFGKSGQSKPALSPDKQVKSTAQHKEEATGPFVQCAEKKAKYEAELAAYRKTIAEQQEAERRKQAELRAAKDAAARAQAEHQAERAAHARLIEEHTRRQMEYEAARNRHALCINGNAQACEGLKQAGVAEGGASTATDATRCVTNPVVFPSRVRKETMEARLVNNCETHVDIRICLLREGGGWHCGVRLGVAPQGSMSWDASKATGEVFWDARVMGSGKPLASPGGN